MSKDLPLLFDLSITETMGAFISDMVFMCTLKILSRMVSLVKKKKKATKPLDLQKDND